MFANKLGLASIIAAKVYGFNVGVISDMHTNMYYDPTVSTDTNCMKNDKSVTSDVYSPWVRFGCDPSADLVDAML